MQPVFSIQYYNATMAMSHGLGVARETASPSPSAIVRTVTHMPVNYKARVSDPRTGARRRSHTCMYRAALSETGHALLVVVTVCVYCYRANAPRSLGSLPA